MHDATEQIRPAHLGGGSQRLNRSEIYQYVMVLATGRRIVVGIVTGDIRRVHCADVWVNPENTDMAMARPEECSISAIIRFEGAHRDDTGSVVNDCIVEELHQKVHRHRPVAPGTAVTTGAGALTASHGVRNIIHTAAVQGEPGEGYRQIRDVGRCVTNVLIEADRLGVGGDAVESVLFPLLGCGMGAGDAPTTVRALLGSALDYLDTHPDSGITTVYFLAYTDEELQACRQILADVSRHEQAGCCGHTVHDEVRPAAPAPEVGGAVLRYATVLSRLQTLSTHAGRTEVIRLLPPQLGGMIARHPQPQLDLISIVRSCLGYPNGLASLFDILAQIEGDSLAMRQVLSARPRPSHQDFEETTAIDTIGMEHPPWT